MSTNPAAANAAAQQAQALSAAAVTAKVQAGQYQQQQPSASGASALATAPVSLGLQPQGTAAIAGAGTAAMAAQPGIVYSPAVQTLKNLCDQVSLPGTGTSTLATTNTFLDFARESFFFPFSSYLQSIRSHCRMDSPEKGSPASHTPYRYMPRPPRQCARRNSWCTSVLFTLQSKGKIRRRDRFVHIVLLQWCATATVPFYYYYYYYLKSGSSQLPSC